MLAYTYEYDGKKYRVHGYNLDEARHNAVLEAFFRFHEGDPRIGMKVQEGTDYNKIDPIKRRGPQLFEYAQMNINDFPIDSRALVSAIKHAYNTTSVAYPFSEAPKEAPRLRIKTMADIQLEKERERRAVQKMMKEKKRVRRCSGFLSDRDCDIAEAAYSRNPLFIVRFPKEDYQILASWYCKTRGLSVINEADRFIKIPGEDAVNIGGVRHVWQDRKGTSSYRAQPYCMAIQDAIRNYDKYLDIERTYREKYDRE